MAKINNKFYISRNILANASFSQLNRQTQKPNHSILHRCKNLLATHLTAVIKCRYTFNFMFTFLPSTKFEIDNSHISQGKLFECTFNDLICFLQIQIFLISISSSPSLPTLFQTVAGYLWVEVKGWQPFF